MLICVTRYFNRFVAALILLTALHSVANAQVVSVTCANAATDSVIINNAIAASPAGAEIQIHGTCLVNQTIVLYPNRSYLGDSRTGTVIQQADGANLTALMASQGWVADSSFTDNPVTIAHMTLNGNSQSNSGTNVLVIRSWQTTIEDLAVENAPGDGILFTSVGQNGTAASNTMVNSRVSNVFIANSGNNGFEVVDPNNSVTDSDLLDSWIASSGQSAVVLANSAGWKLSGNHIYGVQQHAIFAQRCFGTTIEGNYIEDFGDAGGATFYGIACTLQGGVGSVIRNNKVFQINTEPASGNWIYIGIPWVNYGAGLVNVCDNVIVGARTNNDTGLSYQATGTKTLAVLSSNNVSGVHTGLLQGAGVSLVASDDGAAPKLTPVVSVAPPASSVSVNQGFNITGTVTSTGETATGTVTLSGGGYTSATEPVVAGTFTITIPANSLSIGADLLTVQYSGDSNYAAAIGNTTVSITAPVLLTPGVTVTPSAASIGTGESLNVAASVTGTGATPTGVITLSGGGYTSAPESLVGGSYTFTIPANSLSMGSYLLTVSYSGDTNYAAATGSGSVSVTQSTYMLAATAVSVKAGSTASSTVTVTSTNGYTGTVSLACTLTAFPAGATVLPSCSCSAPQVALNSSASVATAVFTVSTQTASAAKAVRGAGSPSSWKLAAGAPVLAFLILLGVPDRHRNWRALVGSVALAATLGGLIGCGSSQSNKQAASPGTTPGSYTFTVTGTGSPAISPAPTATFTLTVD